MMQPKEEESYSRPLAERVDESEEDLESLETNTKVWDHREGRKRRWLYYAAAAALLVATTFVSAHVGARLASGTADLDGACAKHTTQWSPLLREVQVRYNWQHFNGTFLEEDVYRREGSPEVDAAWEALGVDCESTTAANLPSPWDDMCANRGGIADRAGVISIEDGLKSGMDMSFVRRSEKYGAGFFVNVEGMHHLHCLVSREPYPTAEGW